jgi:DNA-binding MarR family transcriptional regulator
MKFEKQNSAGYLANHMARLFAQGLHDRIKPLGIVPGQFPALLALWERDGLTQKELIAKLDIEQATMANTLSRMERDGLIRRTKHPSDARAQQIWLTARAKSKRDAAYEAAMHVNKQALSNLSETEEKLFLDFMGRTIQAMQE